MGKALITKRLAELFLSDEHVSTIPLVDWEVYRRHSPPIFEKPARLPNMPAFQAQELSGGLKLGNYYRVSRFEGFYYLSDDFPGNEAYCNRQYMLFSVYSHLLGDQMRMHGLDFLDVAGSSGYYSLHASRLGFRRVLCVDGRKEYEGPFKLLGELSQAENLDFEFMDVERLGELAERFDVVLAQGILHHIYDHYLFVKTLYRLTKRLLIVDTALNGRMDATLEMWIEDSSNLRDSPFTGMSLCPSLTVLVTLLKQAGFSKIYRVPYPGRIRDDEGNIRDPYRYGSWRRTMLAAMP